MLTLTRGEKGTSDPADFDQPHFAARREQELRASLAVLGVDDVRVLDYRDGECDLVDDEVAIATITEQIDALRPDTVITFGPDGITGHRDHRVGSKDQRVRSRRITASGEDNTLQPPFFNAEAVITDDPSPSLQFSPCSVAEPNDHHRQLLLPAGAPTFATLTITTSLAMERHGVDQGSSGSIDVASVVDTEHRDSSLAHVDSIQDSVAPATGAVDAGKFVSQLASNAARILE